MCHWDAYAGARQIRGAALTESQDRYNGLQAAGVIMLPEQAQGPGITLPSPADKVCFMYLMNDSTGQPSQPNAIHQQNGSSSIDNSVFQLTLSASAAAKQRECSLLVFCQVPLQPERAISWIRGLLTVVQAQHVLVLASLPVCALLSTFDVCSLCCADSCECLPAVSVDVENVRASGLRQLWQQTLRLCCC